VIWTPGAVYGFVRAAGFPVECWAAATALALSVSGGDDLFRDVGWPGPSVDRRGLFGVDVVAHPGVGGVDLFDPRDNVRAAYALWTAAGRSFEWSWAAVPPVGSQAYTAAAAAVRAGVTTQPVASSSSPLTSDPDLHRVAVDLAGVSDYVRGLLIAGR